MKKMSKIVLIAGLTIVTTVAVRSYLNHALVDDAVSKVKVAEKCCIDGVIMNVSYLWTRL